MTVFKSAFLVLIITNTASLLQWVFQLTMARILQPAEFSVISAVVSLGPAVFSFFTIIPQLAARVMIEKQLSPLDVDRRLMVLKRMTAISYLIIAGTYILLIRTITGFLKLNNPVPVIIYLFTSATHIFLLYYSGRFQGHLLFVPVALKTFFMAFGKLVLGIWFTIRMELSYNGALLAELLSNAITAVGMGIALRRFEKRIPVDSDNGETRFDRNVKNRLAKRIASYAGPIIAVSWVSSLMISIDMHLAKHFLSPFDAGLYSASATFGRISFFFAESLALMVYPKVLKNRDQNISSRNDILTLLITTFTVSFLISLIQTVFGSHLLKLFYGEIYAQASEILIVITWSMTIISVINILAQYLLAEKYYAFIIPNLVAVMGTVAVIWFLLNSSGVLIAAGHILGSTAMLLVLAFLSLRRNISRKT